MTLLISVGDVILLSQLAYRLGKTLAAGRKSAPSTHKEVQNQLFALSHALRSIVEDDPERPDRSEDCDNDKRQFSKTASSSHEHEYSRNLQTMLENCEDVLERFRTLIEKYTSMGQNADEKCPNRAAKWRGELKSSWKKVRWTMKDDDVENFRKDLAVHIQSLNLAITGSTSFRTKRVEYKVNDVHNMLSDVHKWFNENLKNKKLASATQETSFSSLVTDISLEESMTFELYAALPTGLGPVLLCPMASFGAGWLRCTSSSRSQRLFLCCCSQRLTPRSLSEEDRATEIHKEQLQFSLLSISLIVRLVGERSWQLFATSSKITSLIIKGVEPSDLALFQRYIDQLALLQSQTSVRKGVSSMLVHYSRAEGGRKMISILDTKGETSHFDGQISTITFVANGRQFTQRSIDSVQILHYRSVGFPEGYSSASVGTPIALHEKYGELIFRPLSKGLSGSRFIVNVFHETKLEQLRGTRTLRIFETTCADEEIKREPIRTTCEMVEVEFIAESAAKKFLAIVQAMQKELHIYYLQFPQFREQTLYQSSCGDVIIRDHYLFDATTTVLFNPSNNNYRMIILSGPNDTCVSIEFPLAYFQSLLSNSSGTETPEISAHFVEHLLDRTNVTEQFTNIPLVALGATSTSTLPLRLCRRLVQGEARVSTAASD